MRPRCLCALVIVMILIPSTTTRGQDADKSSYTLFNPTPRELWRPLSADRPDITESPYTVDAGAFQLEMSFIDYAKNGGDETWTFAPFNLKIGLTNDMDLQLVFDPYVDSDTDSGVGDSQIRLKINLWGNDSGSNAFAIMPFIKLPTASDDIGNDEVEGGVIFPYSTDLAEGVGLGLMFETDFVYDEEDDDYDTEFVFTGVLGFDLTDELGLYTEIVGIFTTDSDADDRALLGTGFTYALDENTVLDVGVNIGLTGDADDVNIFSGITVRF
ncbi:MAG: transporter [Planctomycetota bacterium]|nr:transporter [Planctomycetota bacterium]